MGARGPLPDLRVINGSRPSQNKGKDPVPGLRAPPSTPKPPSSVKGEALAEWKRIVPTLDGLGILSTLDRSVLAQYCHAWARYQQLEEILQSEPLFVEVCDDDCVVKIVRHPAYATQVTTGNQLRQLRTVLGLTPASRLRMPRPEGGTADGDDILD